MFCGECGARNPDTNQFCKNCGKPLRKSQAAQPAPQPLSPTATQLAAQPSYPPAAQPAPTPVGSFQQPAAATAPAVAAPKRHWNILGIISLILGIVSLVLLPLLMAFGALLLGIVGTFLFRKTTGRIGITGILGTILALIAIVMTVVL
ncbi:MULTISPECIES: zinc ribbon domain-containing protein [unclassified Methanoregula]|uniref:zinc ribbon domain-containing protein n=1 Tax=unclassified Methanoregula TaxID=2649730 RepID=UPI0009C828DE|nr:MULTISPECIES: zinc ribbon domain-containing protein [unclassified Methanoregula]OPX62267.1 MAG: hypothetical protein A4E33_02336 [Methanoregula sp. PtaB.Bin085]OPY32694.1 MAG: hypothetical protein A4E34_02070 [Methanoregula sp. PtaU1.Bin006]